jgi:hypothetical protein
MPRTKSGRLRDRGLVSLFLPAVMCSSVFGVNDVNEWLYDSVLDAICAACKRCKRRQLVTIRGWYLQCSRRSHDGAHDEAVGEVVLASCHEKGTACGLDRGGRPQCLLWSGVTTRGRRPPAMDGGRNGHGRRRRPATRASRGAADHRTSSYVVSVVRRQRVGPTSPRPTSVTCQRRQTPAVTGFD